ncbi:MAG: GNAT family N-acetyltransferase [Bacteroidaceae bacterium]|nr:GNAT family N-acetyltransferase [Bacteroidaceae bacterium]
MEGMEIKIRKAVSDDAEFIALVVAMALGGDEEHKLYKVFKELSGRENTQYSYCNTLIAEVAGKPAGAIVGYDGGCLKELRIPIFELIRKHTGEVIEIEDETEAGEFYLDSLAVLPEYRSCGVGRMLLCAMRDMAIETGYEKVGLIVDFDNPRAEALYSSLGFERVGRKRFLGHPMWHLQYSR